MAGDEIVQLYIRDEVSSVIRFEKELRGFERISLTPGETKTVHFTLTPEELQMLDRNMNWMVEPGWFTVMLEAHQQISVSRADLKYFPKPSYCPNLMIQHLSIQESLW